ncbi:MAG: peptidoglycan-associated lipoprotein Pal [Acidobacteriota bacterium]|nr:peptidoglycan-associated lipoprotein Pal [Acidobacteriota bacterium]
MRRTSLVLLVLIAFSAAGACAKKQPPVARPTAQPPGVAGTGMPDTNRPPAPPEPVAEPTVIPADPTVTSGDMASRSVDELNKQSPFQPIYFGLDSDQVDGASQAALQQNAQIMKQYPTWVITIEGHCDERGTPEYNLALGERRAISARDYLVSLGIAPDRLKTVSYGNEFPFDQANTEDAYSKNRRAHFVLTAK